ncbi:hypothetical protein GGI07_002681 [Coemansia sp. Benny D115]|nr:hypothetical protein GGI07_002681 [Coemansia sp. Benny D115]
MYGAALLAALAAPVVWQLLKPTPSVKGKRVVIVGASSGIGRSLALEYAGRGAHLVLCARRQERLLQVASECTALSGHPAEPVVGDITERATQLALVDAVRSKWSGIDYLVLNAGVISVLPLSDLWLKTGSLPDAQRVGEIQHMFERTMAVNATAPALVAGLFLPMLAQSKASVVVVASVASLVAAPTRSMYSAAKHAVEGYFATFRMETKKLGVAVTMVYPGTVDTELRLSAVDIGHAGGQKVAGSARGKMSPENCAKAIVRAAALRKRSLVTPWPYWLAVTVHTVAPGLIESLALRKYGL